jgi:hypothetical protein
MMMESKISTPSIGVYQQSDEQDRFEEVVRSDEQEKERVNLPINPENLLNVLGILTLGLTSIKTPFAVWM